MPTTHDIYKIGMVLSGGGMRGLAHAGILQAFEEENIKPDLCTGQKIKFLIYSPFLYPSAASPFPFFPLLGETQKGSGNDPGNHSDFAKVSPLFHRREGARG